MKIPIFERRRASTPHARIQGTADKIWNRKTILVRSDQETLGLLWAKMVDLAFRRGLRASGRQNPTHVTWLGKSLVKA